VIASFRSKRKSLRLAGCVRMECSVGLANFDFPRLAGRRERRRRLGLRGLGRRFLEQPALHLHPDPEGVHEPTLVKIFDSVFMYSTLTPVALVLISQLTEIYEPLNSVDKKYWQSNVNRFRRKVANSQSHDGLEKVLCMLCKVGIRIGF